MQCEASKKGNGKNPKDCLFPFKWKGVLYDTCTGVDFESGQPWCAIKVNKNNVVKDPNRWICQAGCPGAGKSQSAGLILTQSN